MSAGFHSNRPDSSPLIPDISKPIGLCALDIICETSMGQSVDAQGRSESEYVRAVLRINELIQNRQKNPLHYPSFLFNLSQAGKEHQWALNVLHSFTRKVSGAENLSRTRRTVQNGAHWL